MSNLRRLAERVIRSVLHEEDEAADFLDSYEAEKGLGPVPTDVTPHIIRAVSMQGRKGTYYLFLWDTGAKGDYGKPSLGYRFVLPDGLILWQGTDYQPGMIHGDRLGDDRMLRQLISAITDNPETSGGEFEGWTPEQLAFARSEDASELESDYGEVSSYEEGIPGKQFIDLPGYEQQPEEA